MLRSSTRLLLILLLMVVSLSPTSLVQAAGTTYYVSRSQGNDANPGTSPAAPLASISRVNTLTLAPGDRVLFRCGDRWQGEMLTITRNGTAGNPITFGAYPETCSERPIIAGSNPIRGWQAAGTNLYMADLRAGANASRFPLGLNQLFRGSERLPFGRWPNLDQGDGGYVTVAAQPAANQVQASELPPGNWQGARVHLKGMRWYILNREVSAQDGTTLTLNSNVNCYAGGCPGWGFWLSNHLATLDREGEWFYERATGRIYLYTSQGLPADGSIEGAAILKDDARHWGGITLGQDLRQAAAHLVIENLTIERWWRHGIATPQNYDVAEASHVTIRNNLIRDVDKDGISLATWVFNAKDGRPNGWRGGSAMEVIGNTIERANRYGVLLYSRESQFVGNTLREIALLPNLGADGMGCGLTAGEGGCTQDGTAFMVYADKPEDSGNRNLFEANRLERIGYNGFLVFGYGNTIRTTVIKDACQSKGDCAGIRPFGNLNQNPNPVRDMLIEQNIILDTLGATEGAHPTFRAPFAFGINADYSSNVTMRNNVVAGSTTYGLLFKESTGSAEGNLLYGNGLRGGGGGVQINLSTRSRVSLRDNQALALGPGSRTLAIGELASLTSSDANWFFNPYQADHLALGGRGRTLAQWRSETGQDGQSYEAWYSQNANEAPRTGLFVNDTGTAQTIQLGRVPYQSLNQQTVGSSLTLAAYSGQVLVRSNEPIAWPYRLFVPLIRR
ncbi:MAG: hypothetical protein AB4911_00290 [Oscillochloridaceae bacterium umkhey_bin13]